MTTARSSDEVATRSVDSLLRARERRALRRGLARSVLGTTLMVVLYFVLPFDGRLDARAAVGLTLGLAAFGCLLGFQIWQVSQSNHPRVRAIQTLATSAPLFLLIFATTYFLMGESNEAAFNEPLTRTDSLYFTTTVFSTVGFGDIVPTSETARVVTMVQMFGDLILVGLVARILFGAVSSGLKRRGTMQDDAPGA